MERRGRADNRFYQLGFNDAGLWAPPHDVTPPRGLDPTTEYLLRAGRFVREVDERLKVAVPADVANHLTQKLFTPFDAFDQEELWVLLLTTKHEITHEAMVYRGTVNASHVRVGEVFKPAIRLNRPAIIIAHNHPSGDAQPSKDDVHVTNQLIQAGRLLDVTILDHVVVGRNEWISLRERGMGNWS